ncbi:(S)-benzoin forming benzil reductase [Aquibacillus albus]|uniref:Benzil reductase ((S)-benzoin forming) n=1 Tax=Aquibacillus albus TaxID=1168171 RepID=A0ABS2MZT8_9BACI|nr:(S)-benzoin forming benzil reductase [Aquibacillus albus]MBM7571416.1 benzil reductase ((S)-benzoin forming) [Aquibacillus albus]
MEYAIVTGASRGLGESIAKLLMQQGIHVISVARKANIVLEQTAQENKVTYQHETCDLSNINQLEKVFQHIAEHVFSGKTDSVYLINNAAMVEPIERSGHHNLNDLQKHVNVNLLAPMASSSLFIQKANESGMKLVIANVTSGAAERSVYGWSAYCSTKAGLNRFTETVALEQDELGTMNKVFLFNPGIMDTKMQDEIRSSSSDAFKDVETFKQYKTEKSLRDTDVVAKVLIDVLKQGDAIQNGKNYSVKEFL